MRDTKFKLNKLNKEGRMQIKFPYPVKMFSEKTAIENPVILPPNTEVTLISIHHQKSETVYFVDFETVTYCLSVDSQYRLIENPEEDGEDKPDILYNSFTMFYLKNKNIKDCYIAYTTVKKAHTDGFNTTHVLSFAWKAKKRSVLESVLLRMIAHREEVMKYEPTLKLLSIEDSWEIAEL